MNLSIQTLIVLEKPGHPPMYFTPAEAAQMGGGFAQLSQAIKDSQASAEDDDKATEEKPKTARKQCKPNGRGNGKAAAAN